VWNTLFAQRTHKVRAYDHEPVRTSEEAARIRNTNQHEGAKALVFDVDKKLVLLVLPGDCRADVESFTLFLKAKKVRMASKETVEARTGVLIGGVPPFGSAMGLQTYGFTLRENERICLMQGCENDHLYVVAKDYGIGETDVMG
jgi:prolyl-tRNA editing enzyme YbaK/EbsC (Cys-tRNA(Pro) deacylase)